MANPVHLLVWQNWVFGSCFQHRYCVTWHTWPHRNGHTRQQIQRQKYFSNSKISPKFRQTKTFFNKMSENITTFYQDEHMPRSGRAQDWEPHVVGRHQLGDSPHLLRRKTTDKDNLKATLPDIKTSDDNNRKLTRKEYKKHDVIVAKQTELEKFLKFNVIKYAPYAPWGAEVMRTTWVIIEKTDNLSKTGSKIEARLCTMGNSSTEFSKDSVQFESPTCRRDTVKALFSLVPDNKWHIIYIFSGELPPKGSVC